MVGFCRFVFSQKLYASKNGGRRASYIEHVGWHKTGRITLVLEALGDRWSVTSCGLARDLEVVLISLSDLGGQKRPALHDWHTWSMVTSRH